MTLLRRNRPTLGHYIIQYLIYLDTLMQRIIMQCITYRRMPRQQGRFKMAMFLVSLVVVALALGFGVLVVLTVAAVPLRLLAHAQHSGRFVQLGAFEEPPRAPPATGLRSLTFAQQRAA